MIRTLGPRALGRATLARQRLLSRAPHAVADTLEHLVGMQAQAPLSPYVGLWTRLADFEPAELAALIEERRAVRIPLMRATVHLVTAADALALRPLIDIVLERSFNGQPFARNIADVDRVELLATGTALLTERPMTRAELRPLLAERWPEHDAESLTYAISYLVPTVQVPPRGLWGRTGPAALTPTAAWLSGTGAAGTGSPATPDELVRRYLAAFGPATVKDVQTWSGLTKLREVVERCDLVTFRDEAGAELFDLPDAPRPDEDTPAPPRFLPEYDNLLLSHADRSRFITEKRRVPLFPGNGATYGTLLVDGVWRGTWKLVDGTVAVEAFAPLADPDAEAAHASWGWPCA